MIGKRILVERGTTGRIAARNGCTIRWVNMCLTYHPKTKGLLGHKIRRQAIEDYEGYEIDPQRAQI